MRFWPFPAKAQAPIETKESAAARVMVLTPGQAAWSGRDYAAFAKEGYVQNVVANRAIAVVADALSTIPLVVTNGDREVTAGPLIDLLARPNPQQGLQEWQEAWCSYLLISGNAYDEQVQVGGRARELYSLRPDRMKVIPGRNGAPLAYEYKMGGAVARWDAEDGLIHHTRLFHPVDDFYGLSPTEAGAKAVDQHNEGMTWLMRLLQNSARPSGALVVGGESTLTDDQFQKLKLEMQEQYQGSGNAGRPMLLEGGLSWQSMSHSPSDMGIIDMKNSAARDIALAYGVPPMILGIPGDNTYSNYKEARLALYEDTVIPLLMRRCQNLTNWLGPQFNNATIKPNLDEIPAIAEKRETLWDMAERSSSLTINEKREMMGYEPIEGGDVIMTGLGSMPFGGRPPEPVDAKAAAIIAGYELK